MRTALCAQRRAPHGIHRGLPVREDARRRHCAVRSEQQFGSFVLRSFVRTRPAPYDTACAAPSASAQLVGRAMEAAALASLARKLEALDYVVPAEGLPACSGPLLEQARALRSSPLQLRAAWRPSAPPRGGVACFWAASERVCVFRPRSCSVTWCKPRRATGRSSTAPPSRRTSWRRGATRREPAAAPCTRCKQRKQASSPSSGRAVALPPARRGRSCGAWRRWTRCARTAPRC